MGDGVLIGDSVAAMAIAAQSQSAMVNGDPTATMSVVVDNSPNASPASLTATAVSKSQINLAWAETSTNEAGFAIERCTGSTCTNFVQVGTVGANVRAYSATGLSANTTYRFRVRAFNGQSYSFYSNVASRATLAK